MRKYKENHVHSLYDAEKTHFITLKFQETFNEKFPAEGKHYEGEDWCIIKVQLELRLIKTGNQRLTLISRAEFIQNCTDYNLTLNIFHQYTVDVERLQNLIYLPALVFVKLFSVTNIRVISIIVILLVS